MRVSLVSTIRSTLAECPIWDGGRLLYLDLARPTILAIDVARGREEQHALKLSAPLGGICLSQSGALVVFCREGAFSLHPGSFHIRDQLILPDASFTVAPPNDVGVHPAGHVFVATADATETSPTAGVFFVSDERTLTRLTDGYVVGNGPAFSPDGRTVYIADSPTGVIFAYDWLEERRSLENRRIFASDSEGAGLPDGITVDVEGGIWSARWGGGCVIRYLPDGTEDLRIKLPTPLVTSCTFGGERMSTLFITTARTESAAADGYGGHLFSVDVGIAGLLPVVCAIETGGSTRVNRP
jgi:D-xylonolactonase